jgi:DNA-binding transcriptional LysR family regulator
VSPVGLSFLLMCERQDWRFGPTTTTVSLKASVAGKMKHAGPSMKHIDLDALAHFVAVAQQGGLNAASRETGIPKATLSRRVRELEAKLGTPLLERGGTRMKLTEDGRLLFDRAMPLLTDLDGLGADVSARSGLVRGRLRVSIPTLLARFGMGAFAVRFQRTHPAVQLEIDIDDRFLDLTKENYDLVVRANPAPDTTLVGRRFLRTQIVLASLPDMPVPSQQDARVDAVMLTSANHPTEWTIVTPNGELTVTPRATIRCSSMLMVYEAVLAGAGAGLLPAWLVKDDLKAGGLKVWGSVPNRDIEAWALHPPGNLTSPKVRAFVDLLIEQFRERTTI